MPRKKITKTEKKKTSGKTSNESKGLGIKTIGPVRQKKLSMEKDSVLQEPMAMASFEEIQLNAPEDTEPEYEFKLPQEEVTVSDAPFWRRTLAYAIDCAFFYFVPFQIFMYIYLSQTGLLFSDIAGLQEYLMHNISAQIKIMAGFVAALFVFLFYLMLAEKNFKTTFGKKIMGLEVSGKLTYWTVFLRNITKTIFVWALPIDLAGIFVCRQRFTERISGTKVIYYIKLALSYEMF